MAHNQQVADLWNQMVRKLADDNRISRCQASSLALQGLLFLDDVERSNAAPRITGKLPFKDLEIDVLDTIFHELNNTCTQAE